MCLKRECHSLGFIVMFRGGCRGVMLRSCSRQILWRKRKSGCVCSFWASCRRPVPLVQALLSITDFGWLLMMSSGDGLGSFLSSWCLIQTFLPACRSAADLLLETEQLLYVWHVDKSRRINHVTCAFFWRKKKKAFKSTGSTSASSATRIETTKAQGLFLHRDSSYRKSKVQPRPTKSSWEDLLLSAVRQ